MLLVPCIMFFFDALEASPPKALWLLPRKGKCFHNKVFAMMCWKVTISRGIHGKQPTMLCTYLGLCTSRIEFRWITFILCCNVGMYGGSSSFVMQS